MARPKSEDKKQALLEAATAAFAQSGIAASTSAIARSAGVAEGTLFRYFATKDELLNEMCQLSVKEIFLSEAYRAFGDALFLSLAETTIEFASHDPQRAREIIALGFEAMWHALHEADA
ncbi:TPA: TetR/AcrR family transcriptional regulator [Klebsiella pneumoniae]|nr:TetR/AcrR family transcriptional regulator [Klebsiella pneumoniae]